MCFEFKKPKDYLQSVLILKNIDFFIPKNSMYSFTPIYEKKVFY